MAALLFKAKSLDFEKIWDPRCWGSGELCHPGVNMVAMKKTTQSAVETDVVYRERAKAIPGPGEVTLLGF